jgi:hypothetical protein
LEITAQQAFKLGVLPYRQLSPHLENCCLLLSANVSYQQAEKDLSYLTGLRVAAKTQQRLVHRQVFAAPEEGELIDELSVDGGKVRLRTPKGKPCQWKDYKAVAGDVGIVATYQDHRMLIDWVNAQPLAIPLTCLGDGHDGVWKIVREMSSFSQRREILDWYHRRGKFT